MYKGERFARDRSGLDLSATGEEVGRLRFGINLEITPVRLAKGLDARAEGMRGIKDGSLIFFLSNWEGGSHLPRWKPREKDWWGGVMLCLGYQLDIVAMTPCRQVGMSAWNQG